MSELHATLRPRVVRVPGPPAIACLEWGRRDDPAALLLHGNGGHARWWDPLVPYLVPGWRLVVPHLRGHGESEWAEPPRYRLEDFAGDLLRVLDARLPAPAPVIGHSMGGRVALFLAARHPARVQALGMLDARLDPIDAAFAARFRARVAGTREGRAHPTREAAVAAFRFVPDEPGVDPRIVAHLAAHAVHERRPGAWAFRFDRGVLSLAGDGAGDLRALLPALRCPTWVAAGAGSWVMPAPELARLRAAVPRAATAVFPGAHHFLLRCPERVGPALRAFLDGARGTR